MHHETLFKSFKIPTIIQTGKRRPEQISKKKKIGNNISNLLYNKMENYTKKSRQRIEMDSYVLVDMLVTCDTAHFETSLLNTDAP